MHNTQNISPHINRFTVSFCTYFKLCGRGGFVSGNLVSWPVEPLVVPLVPLPLPLGLVVEPLVVPLQLGHRSSSLTSTLLYYISRSSGYRHRNPNINVREIIWLGNQLIPHQTHISILSSLSLDGFVFVWIFRWMDFQSFLHVSICFGQSWGVATQRTDISMLSSLSEDVAAGGGGATELFLRKNLRSEIGWEATM